MQWTGLSTSGTPREAAMPVRRTMTPAKTQMPPLRLSGRPAKTPQPLENVGQPIIAATDPRWVLAMRVAESLQGAVLGPEKREKLLRLGRTLNLTPFDTNLIIAIVQDQARRGHPPAQCPSAGAEQLTMIPLPGEQGIMAMFRGWRAVNTFAIIMTIIALEVALIVWWMKS